MGNTMKALGRVLVSPLSIIDKDLGRTVLQIAGTVAAFIPGGQPFAAAAMFASATLWSKKAPPVPLGQLERLNAGLNPTAARTGALGDTALPADIRFAA
jgi:hypothetical protein